MQVHRSRSNRVQNCENYSINILPLQEGEGWGEVYNYLTNLLSSYSMVITWRKEVFMIYQNVFRAGNSAAVTLSKQVLEETGIKIGDRIQVKTSTKPVKVEFIPAPKKILRHNAGITAPFIQSVEEFISEFRPALEELAKR